jgi:hypothetical protein
MLADRNPSHSASETRSKAPERLASSQRGRDAALSFVLSAMFDRLRRLRQRKSGGELMDGYPPWLRHRLCGMLESSLNTRRYAASL